MFALYDKNMREIELPKGVTPLDIFISSIGKERVTSTVEGSDVKVDYGSIYTDSDISLSLLLNARNTVDYRLQRDEVYATFDKTDEVYVSETYQSGKRYLVSIDSKFIPERINRTASTAEIECTKIGLPFGESIVTSAYVDRHGIRHNDKLTYGLGYSNHRNEYIYSHTFKEFRIFNPGSATVHPFDQDLRIEITNINDSNFKIMNETTLEQLVVKKPLKRTDRLELRGPEIFINDTNAFRDTNRAFISMAPGWNYFKMSSNAKTFFDFRFNYK